jgi:hypothetical protein
MQEVVGVEEFYPLKNLVRKHEDCFQRETTVLFAEKILKRRPQEVHHHRIVVTLNARPMD